jgi:hypothetical protein
MEQSAIAETHDVLKVTVSTSNHKTSAEVILEQHYNAEMGGGDAASCVNLCDTADLLRSICGGGSAGRNNCLPDDNKAVPDGTALDESSSSYSNLHHQSPPVSPNCQKRGRFLVWPVALGGPSLVPPGIGCRVSTA